MHCIYFALLFFWCVQMLRYRGVVWRWFRTSEKFVSPVLKVFIDKEWSKMKNAEKWGEWKDGTYKWKYLNKERKWNLGCNYENKNLQKKNAWGMTELAVIYSCLTSAKFSFVAVLNLAAFHRWHTKRHASMDQARASKQFRISGLFTGWVCIFQCVTNISKRT